MRLISAWVDHELYDCGGMIMASMSNSMAECDEHVMIQMFMIIVSRTIIAAGILSYV
jgi:hypothetical protein